MEKYFLIGLIFLGILVIVCLIIIYMLYKEINNIKNRQLKLNEKLADKKIEDVLYNIFEENSNLKISLRDTKRELNYIKEKQNNCFDKINIVRYPSTAENEAKLSYSVGLTNENGDALVITGLQYRNGCNMYYKQVKDGIPDFELSNEEKKVLNRSNVKNVIIPRRK